MSVSVGELALWTPVAFTADTRGAVIDWADMRGSRFTEPFFHQSVERWAAEDPRPLVRTGIEALRALDNAPSLDPTALIFHSSRCGSTLLSRLLGCVPEVLVVSEPAPVNTLLLAEPETFADTSASEALRLLVRALGRRRFGDERHYIVKLSSWNITHLSLFRRAFPAAALVWLAREPRAVVASLLTDPPGWLDLRHDPAAARAAFGIDDPVSDTATFCVQVVSALLAAAGKFDGSALILDYQALPEAAWTVVAPHLGIEVGPGHLERMRDLARYQAKAAARRPFAADAARPKPLAPAIAALVDASAVPVYEAVRRGPGGDLAQRLRL